MNNKYQLINIKFDDNRSIKHHSSPIKSSISTIFVDTIQLNKYGNIFLGKQIEIIFEFNNELLLLTEITFNNEPAMFINTTLGFNNTTNCSIGKINFVFSQINKYYFELFSIK